MSATSRVEITYGLVHHVSNLYLIPEEMELMELLSREKKRMD